MAKRTSKRKVAKKAPLADAKPTSLGEWKKFDDSDPAPTIAIITALPHEHAAVKVLLPQGGAYTVPGRGGGRDHWIARVPARGEGQHEVALHLAGVGNNVAALRAALICHQFPSVELVVMVGIAGAVPWPERPAEHVRLGDIIVSNRKGIIQYDFVKVANAFKEVRATPIPPGPRALDALDLVRSDAEAGHHPWENPLRKALDLLGWKRPDESLDVLASTEDPAKLTAHPKDPARKLGLPRLFIGPVASANTLLKDSKLRDKLRDQFGVKCVEMEGSGVADAAWNAERGYLVVRGACDYCDDNKNDNWQRYAAAVAASFAVHLLGTMTPSQPLVAKPALEPMLTERLSRLFSRTHRFKTMLNQLLQAVQPTNDRAVRAGFQQSLANLLYYDVPDPGSNSVRESRQALLAAIRTLDDGALHSILRDNQLEREDLQGMDFSNTNLDGISFCGAFMLQTDLSNASLVGADLTNASVRNARFSGADLAKANFKSVDWFNAIGLLPGQLARARGPFLPCPTCTGEFMRVLDDRYRYPFSSWPRGIQEELRIAWATYSGEPWSSTFRAAQLAATRL